MKFTILRFVTLLLTGFIAGALTIVWLLDRAITSAAVYIPLKQTEITLLTVALPLLGVLTTVLAIGQAVIVRHHRGVLWLTLAAVVCLLAMGILTVFVFFPLNAQIMAWSPQAPPADWNSVRARWNAAHALRTLFGIGSFTLLLLAALVRQTASIAERQPVPSQHQPAQGQV